MPVKFLAGAQIIIDAGINELPKQLSRKTLPFILKVEKIASIAF